MSMRRSRVIIGNVQNENIGNGIRKMAKFGRAVGLDRDGGCGASLLGPHEQTFEWGLRGYETLSK